MRLLISDANILMDLVAVQLEHAVFALPFEFAVPDILFEEELRERHGHLRGLGLQVLPMGGDQVAEVERLASIDRRPSRNDLFALVLARSLRCGLLTGDKDLRRAAERQGVEVHGTLWLVQEMVSTGIITVNEARSAFAAMRLAGRRLPWGDVELMLEALMTRDS